MVHDENYAHGLIGHSKYLGQYIRLSREERGEKYKQLEPDLFIFDTTKKDEKIRMLKGQFSQLERQIPILVEEAAKRIKEELKREGWDAQKLQFKGA